MALLIGWLLAGALAIFHHGCLRGLDRLGGRDVRRPNLTLIGVFIGLLTVHTIEILLFAGVYRVLLNYPSLGTLAGEFDGSWEGLIYFSGINFVTLGYTQIEAEGPMRLIGMMQSLAGFMLLTWSATFIYSVWSRAFR
ncbi:MAG: hypothetical protein JJ913_09225 [Rhizobiaceae bacterium]|nr:hypothetical protein [Rhizobiaceae bacterium]